MNHDYWLQGHMTSKLTIIYVISDTIIVFICVELSGCLTVVQT